MDLHPGRKSFLKNILGATKDRAKIEEKRHKLTKIFLHPTGRHAPAAPQPVASGRD
jgi:hypothetical protein